MENFDAVNLASALVVLAFMVSTWVLSLLLRDASIVDIAWPLGFVIVAWLVFVVGEGPIERRTLVTALVTIWGLRLAVHMLRLRWGKGEDFRYRDMRARHGSRFPVVSLFSVYLLQALGMWAVSLPTQAASALPGPSGLTALDLAGLSLWVVGMVFEVGGDRQLAQFRADPRNRGQVMDRGLWRYTRHPNYFGDFCVWWGMFVIALASDTPEAWWAIAGPLTMTLIFWKVFGVPLMEGHLAKTKPGYAEYMRRTSAFFPWRPKASKPPHSG